MGVYHGFEKNETATMFFLKKPSLVMIYVQSRPAIHLMTPKCL